MYVRVLASVLLAALILASALHVSAAPAAPSVKVYVDVRVDGNATVTYVVSGVGGSRFWIFLPKFEKVSGRALDGSFRVAENRTSSFYFYYNSTIEARPGPDGRYAFNMSFGFPYASIMAGYNGWFMTPAIVAEPDIRTLVYVKLPFLKRVTLEEPSHVGKVDGYLVYELYGPLYLELGGRVTIEYDMTRPTPTAKVSRSFSGVEVLVEYPVYYRRFALKTAEIAGKAVPLYIDLFHAKPSKIEFRFYLPKQAMGGIGTLGFMRGSDVNVGGRGPIELNLALMRYAPGYHETTVLHEMVHKFLGMIGVEATDETRWIHEGLAQYVSIRAGKRLGLPIGDLEKMLDNSSKRLVERLHGNLGFIQEWPYGNPALEGEAYLASYYIVKTVADKYGGLDYVSRLATAIKEHGGVKDTQDIVDVMSAAAGRDLSGLFVKWGFKGVQPWRGGAAQPTKPAKPKPRPSQQPQGGGNETKPQSPEGAQGGKGGTESFFGNARNLMVTSALVLGGLAAFMVYVVNTRISREISVASSRVYVPGEEEEEAGEAGKEGGGEKPGE